MIAAATSSSSLRRGLLSCGRRWRALPALSQLGLHHEKQGKNRQTFGLFSSSPFSSQAFGLLANTMAPVINPGQDVSTAVAQWIASNDVMVFSKTTCPFCIKLKKAFKQARIDFTAVELDTLETGAEIQNELKAKTSQSTVPNVFVRGKHIGKPLENKLTLVYKVKSNSCKHSKAQLVFTCEQKVNRKLLRKLTESSVHFPSFNQDPIFFHFN